MKYIYLKNLKDVTIYELRNAVNLAAQDLRIQLGEDRIKNDFYKQLTGLNVELYQEIQNRQKVRALIQ